MSGPLRWLVPDRIAPTPLDTMFIAIEGALLELPVVFDSALRKYCGLAEGSRPITDREALVLRAVRQVMTPRDGS
jgi:hypothetical protein